MKTFILTQGAVQHLVPAHHDLGDLVGEVGEEMFPGGHPALGECGRAYAQQGEKENQSLHIHTFFPYKDSATVRFFKITCYHRAEPERGSRSDG